MNISPINIYNDQVKTKPNINTLNSTIKQNNNIKQYSQLSNNYYLPFLGRVEKTLGRFYFVNRDIMPQTVKEYIESLDDINSETPIEAQYNAYQKLEDAHSIEDIKKVYPEENLFKKLIPADQTKATKGLLKTIRSYKELMKLYDLSLLPGNEDLTVYLVKKIFLEAKSIPEINADLDKDLNDEIKAAYKKENNNTNQYIADSTLSTLGIKMPDPRYLTSLRYTKDGYADQIGAVISKSLNEFWASLSPKDRTARAKKTILSFETWWDKLPHIEKLNLIASNDISESMLTAYKKDTRADRKILKEEDPEEYKKQTKENSTKITSKLSQDELFKIWATHNLQNYLKTMSWADQEIVNFKRTTKMIQRWNQMTPEERVEYISKMKAGAEPLRYTMIEAWNNCQDIILSLSDFLKENQIFKPVDVLYSDKEFSEFQSKVMKEFWDLHPEYAEKLGEEIIKAGFLVDNAIADGTFEALKDRINRNKKARQDDINAIQLKRARSTETDDSQEITTTQTPIIQDEEIEDVDPFVTYCKKFKNLPTNFLNDYINYINMNPDSLQRLKTSGDEVSPLLDGHPEQARIFRALSYALQDALYQKTSDPAVYGFGATPLLNLMYNIERHQTPIHITTDEGYHNFKITNNKPINQKRIDLIYEECKKDLPQEDYEQIIDDYFGIDKNSNEYILLQEWLKGYGNSLLLLFSDKNIYPTSAKEWLIKCFATRLPSSTLQAQFRINSQEAFDKEEKINKLNYALGNRYKFLPSEIVNSYANFVARGLRRGNDSIAIIEEISRPKKRESYLPKILYVIAPFYYDYDASLNMLAITKALADVLFEATDDKIVYKLNFENLIYVLEDFSLEEKFPAERLVIIPSKDKNITALRKPHIGQIKHYYKKYKSEIENWEKENKNSDNPDYEDLMCILNPKEDEPEIDEDITNLINSYQLDKKKK